MKKSCDLTVCSLMKYHREEAILSSQKRAWRNEEEMTLTYACHYRHEEHGKHGSMRRREGAEKAQYQVEALREALLSLLLKSRPGLWEKLKCTTILYLLLCHPPLLPEERGSHYLCEESCLKPTYLMKLLNEAGKLCSSWSTYQPSEGCVEKMCLREEEVWKYILSNL